MHNLIQLEFRKTKTGAYSRAVLIISIVMLAMIYLLAVIPKFEPTVANLELSTYRFVAFLLCILEMCVFSILGAVIYSKLVIEEYVGKRVYLLLTYPINRKKIFFAKVKIAFLFSSVAMFATNIIIFGLFFCTESFLHIVNDSLSPAVILSTLAISSVFSVMAGIVALASARIGFARKTTQSTLVSAFVICCIFSQLATPLISIKLILPILLAVFIVIGIVIFAEFLHKIEHLEESL